MKSYRFKNAKADETGHGGNNQSKTELYEKFFPPKKPAMAGIISQKLKYIKGLPAEIEE